MPCTDVTEVIEVVVDGEDRLKEYTLIKRSCGQGVGHEALLLDWLKNHTVDELLAYDNEVFLAEHPMDEEIEEFLTLKHLFAVQAALEVLTGKAPGGPRDACAAATIHQDGDDTVISGRIAVDILTDKIKSCGGCKGCGKNRKQPTPA